MNFIKHIADNGIYLYICNAKLPKANMSENPLIIYISVEADNSR